MAGGRRQLSRRQLILGSAGALSLAAYGSTQEAGALPHGHSAIAQDAVFETAVAAGRAPRFGVNYTPSKHWWNLWDEWDPKRVDHDLAQVASLGVDHIRVMLRWDLFQPDAHTVRAVMLDRLEAMLHSADKHRLDVCVTPLTGFLSGRRFLPLWARGNLATTQSLRPGQLLMFRELGRAVGGSRRLLGFDVGNELLGRFVGTPAAVQQEWLADLVAAAQTAAPGKLHTASGVSKFLVDFPAVAAAVGDVSVVHPWFFFRGAVNSAGRLTTAVQRHAELQVEYMKSFHSYLPEAPRRQVWVQEVGAPDSTIPTRLHPAFVAATMRSTLTCQDLYGITWWDSHDIDTTHVRGFSPPESTLGLFDVAGRLKPAGTAFAAEVKRSKASRGGAPARTVAVANTDPALWQRITDQGHSVAMVPSDRVQDAAYLAARGIPSVRSA